MVRALIRLVILICALQPFFIGIVSLSEAKDLTKVLGRALDVEVAESGQTIPLGTLISPAFAGTIAQAVTQEVPLASVAPAFTYRLNPTVDIYERSTRVPGPLFSERAVTIGEGRLNFGVGYSFIDFNKLNGTDLDNLRGQALAPTFLRREAVRQDVVPLGYPRLADGQQLFFAPLFASVGRVRLDLQAQIFTPTLRYGINDKWDIGLVIPVVHTFLRIRSQRLPVVDALGHQAAFVRNPNGTFADNYPDTVDLAGNPASIVEVPFVKSQRSPSRGVGATGSATGIGDISLRSKYRFWRTEEGGAALGLTLQLPSGEKRDFHGTGETHLSTFLYLSQVIKGWVEPHLNIGVDFNTDDVDRSSFLYAAGVGVLVGKKLGLIVDFIGRSEFARFPIDFPGPTIGTTLNQPLSTCAVKQPCTLKRDKEDPRQPQFEFFPFFPEKIKRNDIINFSFGLRYALGELGSIFFGGIIPLNNDGFRAEFIPSGGIEYTF